MKLIKRLGLAITTLALTISLAACQDTVERNTVVPYGDLKLTDFRMYHILLSLENKGLIKAVYRKNGDYYKIL